jgi:ketoreductase RED2
MTVDAGSAMEDRVAIVTGSSSGIGAATAVALADCGFRVVVNSSSSIDAGRAVATSLATDSEYVQADIALREDRERLVGQTLDRFGRLDVLVNNAGWTTPVPHSDLGGLSEEIFRKTFEVNVFATWELTKLAIPHLQAAPDGNVVTMSSVAGARPGGSSIAYAMSKAALNHMTALLARSFGPIRFNTVAPGLIDTPWTEDWDELRRAIESAAPLRRAGTPEEVARAVIAVVTNTYMTGATLFVDGGTAQVF